MTHFFLLLSIVLILFLINGCNETPNSIGKNLLTNEDIGSVRIDTFYATAHSTTLNPYLYTSRIDRFMIGKYNQPYEAWTCLKFNQWPDFMIGATITSATIQLKGVYHFGDSLAPLTFNVYRAMSNLFLSDSLTYDSLKLNSVNSATGKYYDKTSPLSIQTSIPVGDTELVTITISDTTMLHEWFSTNEITDLNHGLVFEPTNSDIIKGFYSFNSSDTTNYPTLVVTYLDTSGNTVTHYHKVGSAKYVPKQSLTSLVTDNNLIYVQNGISYRGLVSFDSILATWPVSIHSAVLQVTLNSSQSSSQFTPFTHDSLYALSVGTDEKSDGLYYPLSECSTDSLGQRIFSFNLRNIVYRWMTNASIRKVALSGYYEISSFDLHTLYGTGGFRPKVIIKYSIQR